MKKGTTISKPEEEYYALTAKEIAALDEISFDKKVMEQYLNRVNTYYTNRMNELLHSERNWWEEMEKRYGFDTYDKTYQVDRLDGKIVITEKVDD